MYWWYHHAVCLVLVFWDVELSGSSFLPKFGGKYTQTCSQHNPTFRLSKLLGLLVWSKSTLSQVHVLELSVINSSLIYFQLYKDFMCCRFFFFFFSVVWLSEAALKQACCKDNTIGGWEDPERGSSSETYGRECEVECSSWPKRSPTFGHDRTVQDNGLEFFKNLISFLSLVFVCPLDFFAKVVASSAAADLLTKTLAMWTALDQSFGLGSFLRYVALWKWPWTYIWCSSFYFLVLRTCVVELNLESNFSCKIKVGVAFIMWAILEFML